MSTKTNLLKELLLEKYGADKLDTGCLLLTQWLNANTDKKISLERIQILIAGDVSPHFSRPQQEAIRKLFGRNYTL